MKNLFLYTFLLLFSTIFAQNKWNFGLVAGGSSKLRMGIPHKETIDYPRSSTTSINVYPFEVFLNGGISARYYLNDRHFLQADLMLHRMDISNNFFYSGSSYNTEGTWNISHTSYRFFQMPITYNWVWNHKKLRSFVGIGIAPSYILAAQHTETYISSYKGTTKSSTNKYELMGYHELQGIRQFKMPIAFEIGFQPLPHTVISLRSSIGIYRHYLGEYLASQDPLICYFMPATQNTNMFSLMAKVYFGK